ncbi:MAG TPA: cold shock domain-containing protein [Phycisphaerae bacterium]|nr:cold shock domain-containing protein [Phycisphaerae bacterium]
MPIGTVKWFDAKKGFGFLLDADGQDVFVHYTIIEGEGYRRLWDGEQVEYECTRGPKGLLASRCRRLSPMPDSPLRDEGEGKPAGKTRPASQ